MAWDQVVPTATTSKLIEVMVRDSTTGAGKTGLAYGSVTFSYWREGASSGTTATCVDMTLGTWTTKGWKEVDATNQKGVYQFGVPNAALEAGAGAVTINFQASGMIDKSVRILLSSPTRGLAAPTALPDAAADAAGGLPISDAGGLDLDTQLGKLDATITSRHASGAAVAKSPATLAAADVSGNLPADVQTVKTRAATDVGAGNTAYFGTVAWSTHSAANVVSALGTGAGLTSLATATELAKVPKSDGAVTWNATALASINAEVDAALEDDPTLNKLDSQIEATP